MSSAAPTTADLLHRIWRRTIQAHDHRLGTLYYMAVEHVRHALEARRRGYALPSMRIPRGTIKARLSTLPARCAEESAKLEGATRRAA